MKLKAILKPILTDSELALLVQSYDVVGDIAVIIVPETLIHRESAIGTAILNSHPNIKVVAKRAGQYSGSYRTIPLQVIAGETRLETIHTEYSLRFKINLETVYFSVRSSTERKRIADLVKRDEQVLVMFSGIAPYPLYIARFSYAVAITGIEINDTAHRYGLENVRINKLSEKISLHLGDVSEVLPQLRNRFDRIVMPLPKTGLRYVEHALDHLNHGGVIHHYVMQQPETVEQAVAEFMHRCARAERNVSKWDLKVCGHTGPNTYRYCIDAHIE